MNIKRMATLFLIVFTDMAGASAIIPIIPLYVQGQFHATPLQATLVISAYYVAQVLAVPWLGSLSDRLGRRPVLLISQAGTIASYLLIVLAAPLGGLLDHAGLQPGMAGGLVIIYLARLLDGVTGGNISVAGAYASDISTPEQRTRALGLVGGASGIGHILGPALAGLLAGIGLLAPFVGAALVSGATFLLTLLWLHEPRRHVNGDSLNNEAVPAERASLFQVLRSLPVALILVMVLLTGIYMAALFGTFALYANRVLLADQAGTLVVRTVGVLITVIGLVTALVQVVLLKPLVGHLGERKAVLLSCFLLLVSAAGFFVFSSLGAFIAFMVVFALGTGVMAPTLQALLTHFGGERMAGRMLGWYQAMFSLALILGPLFGGLIFDAVSPHAVYAASAGLMVLALLLSIGMQRLSLPKAEQPREAIPMHFHH
jgi:DHA1 family tetracycline resistance protein-like MFS transporter